MISEEADTGRVKANRVAVDAAGNRYVFGQFNSNVTFGDGDRSVALNLISRLSALCMVGEKGVSMLLCKQIA